MLRTPYLPGESDMDQLKTIFRALGTPTEEEWPVRHIVRQKLFAIFFLFVCFSVPPSPVRPTRKWNADPGLVHHITFLFHFTRYATR
jgi:hypothetical protein